MEYPSRFIRDAKRMAGVPYTHSTLHCSRILPPREPWNCRETSCRHLAPARSAIYTAHAHPHHRPGTPIATSYAGRYTEALFCRRLAIPPPPYSPLRCSPPSLVRIVSRLAWFWGLLVFPYIPSGRFVCCETFRKSVCEPPDIRHVPLRVTTSRHECGCSVRPRKACSA